jgi:hypothetical protein
MCSEQQVQTPTDQHPPHPPHQARIRASGVHLSRHHHHRQCHLCHPCLQCQGCRRCQENKGNKERRRCPVADRRRRQWQTCLARRCPQGLEWGVERSPQRRLANHRYLHRRTMTLRIPTILTTTTNTTAVIPIPLCQPTQPVRHTRDNPSRPRIPMTTNHLWLSTQRLLVVAAILVQDRILCKHMVIRIAGHPVQVRVRNARCAKDPAT